MYGSDSADSRLFCESALLADELKFNSVITVADIVNLILRKQIDKVDRAESLRAVE